MCETDGVFGDDLDDLRREAAAERRRRNHRYDPLCGCAICEPPEPEEEDDETEEEDA